MSSLRRSPPGCAGCAAELVKRRPPSASFAPRPGPPHTTHTTWRARGESTSSTTTPKAPPRRQDQRHHLGDDHQPEDTPRSSPTKFSSLGVLRALISLGSNPSLLPVYCSAPLPAPAGSFQKRGVPSRPPPRAARGTRKIILGPGPRKSFPQKEAPTLHDL